MDSASGQSQFRFEVWEGAEHQCCYSHTVVDTERKGLYNTDQYVCEVAGEEAAQLIADALNTYVATGWYKCRNYGV